MSHVSRKLSGSIEGALAGGGDPATSPLYVFGPFLALLASAGAVEVSFGAALWLAVFTVATVSAMYRLVMSWVTDGSGGSGLSEEEFGPWAVKVNASITVVEYTLTFLVSMAALVTFIADRVPALDAAVFGISFRTVLAVLLSIVTGAVVNRGPRITARAFGPATAAVLVLLWGMIITTIWKFGFHLPALHLRAFSGKYANVTLGGYARILALMTGIEIFANLVTAYEGPAQRRSNKAFGSLLIIMGTTCLTMLVVGPAIRDLSNPLNPDVSVFTQTMDRLLPGPLAELGTIIGVAVLLSAAAASAQGLQNLALGLRYRHYIPAGLGKRNRFEVADRPVWVEVGVCVACFSAFGTDEETYLALYAAGVFVLLSLTGWASVKRLVRELRAAPSWGHVVALIATIVAAGLTSFATVIIFDERFREGAWIYLLLVPVLYVAFGTFRKRLGAPKTIDDRLGRLLSSGYISPQGDDTAPTGVAFDHILIPLDRTPFTEQSLPVARMLGEAYGSKYTLLTVVDAAADGHDGAAELEHRSALAYLTAVANDLGPSASLEVRSGEAAPEIGKMARSGHIDAVVMTTHGRSAWKAWLPSSITSKVIYQTTPPLILVRPTDSWRSTRTRFERLLVALDGSPVAEQVLPFVPALSDRFHGEVILFSAAEGAESDGFVSNLRQYLERLAAELGKKGVRTRVVVENGAPANAIVRLAESEERDLLMLVSHGRGGVERQAHVRLGSVAAHLVRESPCPVFLVSALEPPSA
ncbi:MAG TPA: universal stress protein [Polyangiaceae bacterium]|jgi:nucleotide-binding universal stress UspA family protein|nr:universal stress protein [Polyangiaceae bacterium]